MYRQWSLFGSSFLFVVVVADYAVYGDDAFFPRQIGGRVRDTEEKVLKINYTKKSGGVRKGIKTEWERSTNETMSYRHEHKKSPILGDTLVLWCVCSAVFADVILMIFQFISGGFSHPF